MKKNKKQRIMNSDSESNSSGNRDGDDGDGDRNDNSDNNKNSNSKYKVILERINSSENDCEYKVTEYISKDDEGIWQSMCKVMYYL
jgi:hypothetical protein